MFHRSVLENTRHYESYTFTANPAHTKHLLYSMKVTSWMECSKLEEQLGGSGGMSRHWRKTGWDRGKTGWDGSSHSRLGCFCGTDRISYFTDFAAPINCCWCGHTHHWYNRQHWVSIQLLKESKERESVFPSKFPGCASACSSKWEGWDLGLIIDLVLLNMELSGNLTQ